MNWLDITPEVSTNDLSIQRKHNQFVVKLKYLLTKQNQNRFFNMHFLKHQARANLIAKIIKPIVQVKRFSAMTFTLSVSLFDAIISQFEMCENQMAKVAIICLSLSSKIHEFNPLYFSDELLIPHPLEDLIKMEFQVLQSLSFNVNVVTPYHFIAEILEYHSLFQEFFQIQSEELSLVHSMSQDLNSAICHSYLINKFTPIGLALTILLLLRDSFGVSLKIPVFVFHVTEISEGELEECLKMVLSIVEKNAKPISFSVKSEELFITNSHQPKQISRIEGQDFLSLQTC